MQDLNDLNFFAAVVTNGGFSAAARALAIPKSRISRRVNALESQLGVRLIERSTRRFSVTEVGKEVYRHARAAVAEAESVAEVVSRLKAEPQGLVRVSCPQGMDRILCVELPNFLDRHPKLHVQVIVSNRRVDLIEEGIDIAVRVREKLDSDVEFQVKILGRAKVGLYASPHFLAASGKPEKPSEIAQFSTLGHTERVGFDRWHLRDANGNEETVTHHPRLAASQFEILTQAAIDGLGIALLPEPSAWNALQDRRLERVLSEWSSPEGIIHLVFTSRRGLLPSVRATIDFLAGILEPDHPGWRH
ncbi:MAG TPA: LysR family transcriptional regulator [Rhizomicrobium sp.]|nr:LysR family transcriptional regulator [Rhizomicrobium sp.]